MWWALIVLVIFFSVFGENFVGTMLYIVLFEAVYAMVVCSDNTIANKTQTEFSGILAMALMGITVHTVGTFVLGIRSTMSQMFFFLLIVIGQYVIVKFKSQKTISNVDQEKMTQMKSILNDFPHFCEGFKKYIFFHRGDQPNIIIIEITIFDAAIKKQVLDNMDKDASVSTDIKDTLRKNSFWGDYNPSNMRWLIENVMESGTIDDDDLKHQCSFFTRGSEFTVLLNEIKELYPQAEVYKNGFGFSIWFKK